MRQGAAHTNAEVTLSAPKQGAAFERAGLAAMAKALVSMDVKP